MLGLASTVDLSILIEKDVEAICFGARSVRLHFGHQVHLGIESDLVLRIPSHKTLRFNKYHRYASLICDLMQQTVCGAGRDKDGGLILRFQSGASLHVLNSNVGYESFQLHIGDQIYVA